MDDEFKSMTVEEFIKAHDFSGFTDLVIIGIMKEKDEDGNDLYVASNSFYELSVSMITEAQEYMEKIVHDETE